MGMDLTLCPIKHDHLHWWLAYDRISVLRDYRMFAQLGVKYYDEPVTPVCQPRPIPPSIKFDWYGDDGIETKTTDPYGSELTYATAMELAGIKLIENTHQWNKGVLAFIKAMPPTTPIVLWWH